MYLIYFYKLYFKKFIIIINLQIKSYFICRLIIKRGNLMSIIEESVVFEQEKLVQSPYNTNVAFYVHLNEYNNQVREELEKD